MNPAPNGEQESDSIALLGEDYKFQPDFELLNIRSEDNKTDEFLSCCFDQVFDGCNVYCLAARHPVRAIFFLDILQEIKCSSFDFCQLTMYWFRYNVRNHFLIYIYIN